MGGKGCRQRSANLLILNYSSAQVLHLLLKICVAGEALFVVIACKAADCNFAAFRCPTETSGATTKGVGSKGVRTTKEKHICELEAEAFTTRGGNDTPTSDVDPEQKESGICRTFLCPQTLRIREMAQ